MQKTTNLASRVLGLHKKCISSAKLKGEERLCADIASFLRASSLEGMLKCGWFHVPNEIGIRANHYMLAKRHTIGVISGVPDFVFFWDGGYGFIEIKQGKGRLSPSQVDFRDYWLSSEKAKFEVARSLEKVQEILSKWGVM